MIRDRNINYKYKTEYWPVGTFSCFTGASGATVDAVDGNPLVGLSGVVGLRMSAPDASVRHLFPMPSHWDTGNKIHCRAIWTDSGTSANSVTFSILYKEQTFGQAPVAGSTALDTKIVADPHCETGSGINATKWGTINADSLSADFITLDVELTAESADGMEAVLFGIEWAYLPKLTDGPQVSDQADPTDA